MQKVIVIAGAWNAASARVAVRRAANDNDTHVDIAVPDSLQSSHGPAEMFWGETWSAFILADLVRRSANEHGTRPKSLSAAQDGVHVSGWAGLGEDGIPARLFAWIGVLVRRAARFWISLWREYEVAHATRKLAGLSDRELHDFGIDRGNIEYAAQHGRHSGEEPSSL